MNTGALKVTELTRGEAAAVSGGVNAQDAQDFAVAYVQTYVRMVTDPVGSIRDAVTYWW